MAMLSIAQKTSAPVDLAEHLRSHIDKNFHDTHPDDFASDYARLAKLRNAAVLTNADIKQEAHPSLLRDLTAYYAQLVFLASKFPDDVRRPSGFADQVDRRRLLVAARVHLSFGRRPALWCSAESTAHRARSRTV